MVSEAGRSPLTQSPDRGDNRGDVCRHWIRPTPIRIHGRLIAKEKEETGFISELR